MTEVIRVPDMSGYVVSAALLASIASTLLGYDIGVTSGALLFIGDDFQLTNFQKELFVSSLSFVSLLGALLAGRASDTWGRRAALALASLLFLVGSLAMALAPTYAALMAGRLITGLGVGFGFTVAPMYTAELSPPAFRGRLVALSELCINAGILLGYLSSFCLHSLPAGANWRAMLGLGGLPALALAAAVLWGGMPESPRWLAMQGRLGEALSVLQRCHGGDAEQAEVHAQASLDAMLAQCVAGSDGSAPVLPGPGPVSVGSLWAPAHTWTREDKRHRHRHRHREMEGEAEEVGREEGSAALLTLHQQLHSSGTALLLPDSSSYSSSSSFSHVLHSPPPSASSGDRGVWRDLLLHPTMAVRRMLLLCVATNFFQQATGVDALVYYSPVLFAQAGMATRAQQLAATLALGAVKTTCTLAAMMVLDKFGRRPLLLLSTAGMTAALLAESAGFFLLTPGPGTVVHSTASASAPASPATSAAYAAWLAPVLSLCALCLFLAAFSFGLGPICWLFTSELFPVRLRAQAMAVGTAVNRVASGTVALTFLSLGDAITPAGTFLLFAAISATATMFFFVYAPETKGKTLEEVASMFQQQGDDGDLGRLLELMVQLDSIGAEEKEEKVKGQSMPPTHSLTKLRLSACFGHAMDAGNVELGSKDVS